MREATLSQSTIPALVDELRRLGVKTSVFSLPMYTPVPECRYRDHDEAEAAIVDLYPVDGPHSEVCPACAARIALDVDIRAIDIKRIDFPTVIPVADEPEPTSGRVTVTDRDGRVATAEKVGVEFEVAVFGRNVLALDLSTATGVAAAKVLRDALDAAIKDAA